MSVQHEKSVIMASDGDQVPQFATVSTSTLQIKVRVPRSPSPMASRASTTTSTRPSRLESRPPTGSGNQLAVSSNRSQYSRSLSPRPLRSSEAVNRPPPPSPSGLLPTRSPTPPNNNICHSVPNTPKIQSRRLEVPCSTSSRGHLTPRSVSPRCYCCCCF